MKKSTDKIPETTHTLTSIEELETVYGKPVPGSLAKELDHISEHYGKFITRSPFVIVATSGPEGLDCSPRGDPPGFVRIKDSRTLLIPDRRGNNRIDTLRNLVRNPAISLLFLIPGIGETIRVTGSARILTIPALLESFQMNNKLPRSVIEISVHSVYFQCQKALARSQLWESKSRIERKELPSTGTMIQQMMEKQHEEFDGKAYDEGYAERMKRTIY